MFNHVYARAGWADHYFIIAKDIYEMLDCNKNIYDYNLPLFFKEFIQWNGTNKDVDKILELNKIIKDYHKSNLK